MSKVFLSIIIPIYNASIYLDSCIQSVYKQTFSNWELILIDDGSIDNSLILAKNWAEKDHRIKVLQHLNRANKGVSASRNLGIKHAKGEWLAFLDADDVWLPGKLQKQYEIIEQYESQGLVFVYCPAMVIDEQGNSISEKDLVKSHNPMFGIYGAGVLGFQQHAFTWVINKGFEAPTSSVVCRKDVIQALGGFEEDMHYSEDGLMWYRIIEKGNMYYTDEPFVQYRVHQTQWNAGVTNQLKLARRFVGYTKLLEKTDEHHKSYVSFLLVNKGFRIIVRNNSGYPVLNIKAIREYWNKLWRNKRVFRIHKLYAFLVIASEFLISPLRIIKFSLKG